jgi:hypothetical protein
MPGAAMKTSKLLGALSLAAVSTASATVLAAAYFARRVVVPTTARREDLAVLKVFSGEGGSLFIDLPKTPLTRAPGRYSLWFAEGKGHACIGDVIDEDTKAGTVTRLVERVDSGDLHAARAGIWSGYAYSKPEQLRLPFEHVSIQVDNGVAPAWKFERSTDGSASSTWAIHIHGMGGKRAGALRGVPVVNKLGLTSLVVSFRNDGEAPPSNDSRYSLGQNEWRISKRPSSSLWTRVPSGSSCSAGPWGAPWLCGRLTLGACGPNHWVGTDSSCIGLGQDFDV